MKMSTCTQVKLKESCIDPFMTYINKLLDLETYLCTCTPRSQGLDTMSMTAWK